MNLGPGIEGRGQWCQLKEFSLNPNLDLDLNLLLFTRALKNRLISRLGLRIGS